MDASAEADGFEAHGQRVLFRSSEDLSPLPDGSVDVVVTSPPYWDTKDYGHGNQIGREGYDEYLDRLDRVWAECFRTARDRAVMCVNVGHVRRAGRLYPIGFDVRWRAERIGWVLVDLLTWFVPNALPQPDAMRERAFDNKNELVLVFCRGGADGYVMHKPRVPAKYAGRDARDGKLNSAGRCLGNVVRIPAYKPPGVRGMGYHQAAFPDELAALLVHTYSDEGGTVLDPFAGSGTVLKACRGMGRSGVGVEVLADHERLIRSRLEEPFAVPRWADLDVIGSGGREGRRRAAAAPGQGVLLG